MFLGMVMAQMAYLNAPELLRTLLRRTIVTSFIQSYLYQLFNNSHSLNYYRKLLRRPFNCYLSYLEAISIGWDIKQINR